MRTFSTRVINSFLFSVGPQAGRHSDGRTTYLCFVFLEFLRDPAVDEITFLPGWNTEEEGICYAIFLSQIEQHGIRRFDDMSSCIYRVRANTLSISFSQCYRVVRPYLKGALPKNYHLFFLAQAVSLKRVELIYFLSPPPFRKTCAYATRASSLPGRTQ